MKSPHSTIVRIIVLLLLFSTSNLTGAQSDITVAFAESYSFSNESYMTHYIPVILTEASSTTVTVDFTFTHATASSSLSGSGQDFIATQSGTLVFSPGSTQQNIIVSIVDDTINEIDELFDIRLDNPSNAILGATNYHTHTIIDNDRNLLVDVVQDFGAQGDGTTDDTSAIQAASDAVYNSGGGVVYFPPGVYMVTSVDIRDNITYHGYGATIIRPPMQGRWIRTFTTERVAYSSSQDSKPLIITGLIFDGNSAQQGPYQNYELEHAHLLFLNADPSNTGRLQVIVEDSTFQNNVGDGISVHVNVSVTVHNCIATDVFRGGVVLTGGYTIAELTSFTTSGDIDATGIDIEISDPGYGGIFQVNVKLSDIFLDDGDFDVAVSEGSSVVGHNIRANAPFVLYAKDSMILFTDSVFKVGAAGAGGRNLIIYPHNVLFENCEMYLTRQTTDDMVTPEFFAIANIWWQVDEPSRNQSLTFHNCRFLIDETISPSDTTYVVYSRTDPGNNNSTLHITGGCISTLFDAWVVVEPEGVVPTLMTTPCQ